jgi:hypothetical protein
VLFATHPIYLIILLSSTIQLTGKMFTPYETTVGALLLHQSTSLLLYSTGTTLGASGKLRSLFSTTPSKSTLAFFAGMAASFLPLALWIPEVVTTFPAAPVTLSQALITLVCGGLVGWGTKVCVAVPLFASLWTGNASGEQVECEMDNVLIQT